MGSIQLSVNTDNMIDAAARYGIIVAAVEDLKKTAAGWADSVEAGELDADEMFSILRQLTDRTDQMHEYIGKAEDLLAEQTSELRRVLGW